MFSKNYIMDFDMHSDDVKLLLKSVKNLNNVSIYRKIC